MIFSSLEFVCIFLPVVFILYCVMPVLPLKNALLIMASLLFYAYGEPVYVLFMIASAFLNYLLARMIAAFRHKKVLLAAAVIANLGFLAYFKYVSFLAGVWNQITGMELPVREAALPIGISFFTFQALSYVIDVYYGRVAVQKSFWKVLLYISFFPQLIAGPIVKYRDIETALSERKMNLICVSEGLRRFICGLGKKVLIANATGQVADAVFAAGQSRINILSAWIGAIAYMLQIYYDFSGYSDMAIGLGKMFGFQFQENFRYPYGADSIKEFWRRWHISLSTWFKEYLYIPLGGNRKGKVRTGFNKLLVFFFTGLWHGAGWTFIIWGLYHGLLSMLEEYTSFAKKLPKAVAHIYTLLVVCIGFVIFRADTISQGLFIIGQMFTGFSFDSASVSFACQQLTPWFLVMVTAGIIGMAPIRPLVEKIQTFMEQETATKKQEFLKMLFPTASVLLLSWCILRLAGGTYNPFIYFRF